MTSKSPPDYSDAFVGLSIQRGLIYASGFLCVETTIWGGLSFFLPEGWWHMAINIPFFLLSIAVAVEIKKWLVGIKKPSWVGYVAGLSVWVVAVGIWRSIVLEMLEGIF